MPESSSESLPIYVHITLFGEDAEARIAEVLRYDPSRRAPTFTLVILSTT